MTTYVMERADQVVEVLVVDTSFTTDVMLESNSKTKGSIRDTYATEYHKIHTLQQSQEPFSSQP